MKEASNIKDVASLKPDYMGFIFYEKSKRFYGDPGELPGLDHGISKTAVFVNEDPVHILKICRLMKMDAVQLHGDESPDVCRLLRNSGLIVIKAFNISSLEDLSGTEAYTDHVDFFLLDASSGSKRGGTGKKFNWKLLEDFKFGRPFFLSGGIQPGDEKRILRIRNPHLYGVDLNSGFEEIPGLKKVKMLDSFMNKLRDEI